MAAVVVIVVVCPGSNGLKSASVIRWLDSSEAMEEVAAPDAIIKTEPWLCREQFGALLTKTRYCRGLAGQCIVITDTTSLFGHLDSFWWFAAPPLVLAVSQCDRPLEA